MTQRDDTMKDSPKRFFLELAPTDKDVLFKRYLTVIHFLSDVNVFMKEIVPLNGKNIDSFLN